MLLCLLVLILLCSFSLYNHFHFPFFLIQACVVLLDCIPCFLCSSVPPVAFCRYFNPSYKRKHYVAIWVEDVNKNTDGPYIRYYVMWRLRHVAIKCYGGAWDIYMTRWIYTNSLCVYILSSLLMYISVSVRVSTLS